MTVPGPPASPFRPPCCCWLSGAPHRPSAGVARQKSTTPGDAAGDGCRGRGRRPAAAPHEPTRTSATRHQRRPNSVQSLTRDIRGRRSDPLPRLPCRGSIWLAGRARHRVHHRPMASVANISEVLEGRVPLKIACATRSRQWRRAIVELDRDRCSVVARQRRCGRSAKADLTASGLEEVPFVHRRRRAGVLVEHVRQRVRDLVSAGRRKHADEIRRRRGASHARVASRTRQGDRVEQVRSEASVRANGAHSYLHERVVVDVPNRKWEHHLRAHGVSRIDFYGCGDRRSSAQTRIWSGTIYRRCPMGLRSTRYA